MTNIFISARKGGGAPLDMLHGTVSFKPTLAHPRADAFVLPKATVYDLIDGQVTATNVQPTPEPVDGLIEWAYEVTFKDWHGQSFKYLVGVPDSTSTVNFGQLPRYSETKPPLFGTGPQGEPGESATVTIGAVTSGETPSVTNVGTAQDAVLNFVLAKGDKGDKGDPGADGVDGASSDLKNVILETARLDGWAGVFAPELSELTLGEGNTVQTMRNAIGDGVFTAETVAPTLTEDGRGMYEGTMLLPPSNMVGGALVGDYTIIQVVRNVRHSINAVSGYSLSGPTTTTRVGFRHLPNDRLIQVTDGTTNIRPVTRTKLRPKSANIVDFTRTTSGADQTFFVNGSLNSVAKWSGSELATVASLRLGGFSDWTGSNATAYPYDGEILFTAYGRNLTKVQVRRLRKLVADYYGISLEQDFSPATRVATVDSRGNLVHCDGDPHLITNQTIMSISKHLTAQLVRKYITDESELEEEMELIADDVMITSIGDDLFQAGDVVKIIDLIYAAFLPSNNLAPRALARYVAEHYIEPTSSVPAVKRFTIKLNELLVEYGFTNAHTTAPGGGGRLSAYQTAKLLQKTNEDPLLREIAGTLSRSISVGGANARSIMLTHTISPNIPPTTNLEIVSAKTGTGGDTHNLVVTWRYEGEEYTTAVLGVISDDPYVTRYDEFFKGAYQVIEGNRDLKIYYSQQMGSATNSLSYYDITEELSSVSRTSGTWSGVFLAKEGATVTIQFNEVSVPTGTTTWTSLLSPPFTPRVTVSSTLAVVTSVSSRVPLTTAFVSLLEGGTLALHVPTATGVTYRVVSGSLTFVGERPEDRRGFMPLLGYPAQRS